MIKNRKVLSNKINKLFYILIIIVIFSNIVLIPNISNAASVKQEVKSGISSFPSDYQALLNKLIDETDHTNWKFYAYYTGIDWDDLVKAEGSCKKNRIHKSFDTVLRCSCGNVADEYYCANDNATAYYMDPRNFINERNIFQFLDISYNSNIQTKAKVEEMVKKYKVFNYGKSVTFIMSDEKHKDYNRTVTMTYTDIIMEAAKQSNMSPINIVAKIVQEVGSNGSGSTSGTNSTYPNCYNFFNIGAYDGDGVTNALKYADNHGWHCPYTSIVEGAIFCGTDYINRGQNTSYFFKFDVVGTSILEPGKSQTVNTNNFYSPQYMTNIMDPYNQSATLFSAYTNTNSLDENLVFIIPIYNNMPEYVVKPSTLLSSDNQDLYYADITSTLSTRTGPGLNYSYGNVTLYKDDLVIMLDRKCKTSGGYDWDKVQFWNGTTGYVASEYLEKYTNSQGEEPNEPVSDEKIVGIGYADVSSSLNIRKGAGTTYAIVGSLKPKEEFEIIGETSGWYKIRTYTNISGYVSKEYVKQIEYAEIEDNNIRIIPYVTADMLAEYLDVDDYTIKKDKTTITNNLLGTNYKFVSGDKEYTIIKMGDVNGDGQVNTGDAFLIQRHAMKLKSLTDNFLAAANVNYDKNTNTGDAFLVQKYALKLTPITLN